MCGKLERVVSAMNSPVLQLDMVLTSNQFAVLMLLLECMNQPCQFQAAVSQLEAAALMLCQQVLNSQQQASPLQVAFPHSRPQVPYIPAMQINPVLQ